MSPHSFCELHFLLGATGVEWPSTASDVVLRCGVCWVLLRDQGNTACCFQGSKCFNWTPFSWMEWYSYVRFYCNYIEGVHGIRPFSPFNSKMSNCRVWSIQTMNILMAGYWMILDHWSWSIISTKLYETHNSQISTDSLKLHWIMDPWWSMKHLWILPWMWLWVCNPILWWQDLSSTGGHRRDVESAMEIVSWLSVGFLDRLWTNI